MANANTPMGLVPISANGSPYWGRCRVYNVPASDGTALFVGDPVIAAGSADAYGVPTATRATAAGGAFITGVMVSVVNGPAAGANAALTVTRDQTRHRLASTNTYIMVADDPDQLFVIQEDGVGGALAAANVSQNADLIAGSGSTTTGQSGWLLDSSTANTTATLQLRIIELMRGPDNAIGTSAKWVVKINLHSLMNTTGI